MASRLLRMLARTDDDPAKDDGERNYCPQLGCDREPQQRARHGRLPGRDRLARRSLVRPPEDEQRQQEQRVLRRDQPRRALDERADVPDRVERGGTDRLPPPKPTRDERDEDGVQDAEQHERKPREREAGRVAERSTQRREHSCRASTHDCNSLHHDDTTLATAS